MPAAGGPNTLGESSLVFAYDTGDVSNSYIGQPTTNIGNNFKDFTGTGYSPDGEWTSNPTSFTKTYYPNLTTPIGLGGTLIQESGTGGYHHLSRYGGGNESGAHSLSCYIYPLVSGITDFCIGMLGDSGNNIQFNLDTRVITYGGGISNRNAFIRDVPGYPGWLRVGANIEGRGGGWVGCFGYSSYTSYTGTAGAKKAYITGIQYEYTTQPTTFVAGTRSATQGLLPLIGNSTLDLTNMSFDSNAKITFDGTDDYISCGTLSLDFSQGITAEVVANFTNTGTWQRLFDFGNGAGSNNILFARYSSTNYLWFEIYNGGSSVSINTAGGIINNQTCHYVATVNGSTAYVYRDGVLINSGTFATVPTTISRTNCYIGKSNWADSYFQGDIPVVKMYNRALSAQEVKQNYQQYKTRFNLS